MQTVSSLLDFCGSKSDIIFPTRLALNSYIEQAYIYIYNSLKQLLQKGVIYDLLPSPVVLCEP